jgi:ATP phosphoribosyltransferase
LAEQVRIALPSKGRLEGDTLDFLAGCGMRVNKTNPRQYTATIQALPGVLVLFQRPRDIPLSVAAGDVDLGITGYDTLAEAEASPAGVASVIVIHNALAYGECALALAVPLGWQDVESVSDLAAKSAQRELRVATRYTNLVRRFFEQHNLARVRIVSADGALEAAPNIGYADFIADITSTGTTLRENNLRPINGGTVLYSQAIFIGNRYALMRRPEVLAITEQMLEFVEAHLRARGQYMIFANMRGESQAEIAERLQTQPDLGGLQWPTIAPLATRPDDGNWWSINLVVSHGRLYAAIQQVRAVGGSGVVVSPIAYIFEERPQRCQQLYEALQQEGIKV